MSTDVATQSKRSLFPSVNTGLVEVADVHLDGSMVLCCDELVCPGAANTHVLNASYQDFRSLIYMTTHYTANTPLPGDVEVDNGAVGVDHDCKTSARTATTD